MFNKEELIYISEALQDDNSKYGEVIRNKIKELTKETDMCIWKFHWDCGRSGDVTGYFRATNQEVEDSLGMRVYFGEILGKHSEVDGVLEERDLTLVSNDPVVVNTYNTSGYNPLDYLEYTCEECGDDYGWDEMFSTSKDNCLCEYCKREQDKIISDKERSK